MYEETDIQNRGIATDKSPPDKNKSNPPSKIQERDTKKMGYKLVKLLVKSKQKTIIAVNHKEQNNMMREYIMPYWIKKYRIFAISIKT